jgi:dethiobiotin synthetase
VSGRGIFITGTDTGIGKTWTAQALMFALKSSGLTVSGMKPVASGAEQTGDRLTNEDALLIQAQASEIHPYEWVNPYVFMAPVAPHIAAEKAGINIDLPPIVEAYKNLAKRSDFVVVEGIGGWRVPLSEQLSTVDLVRALQIPVLLVVGMRLGCINHTLLTTECIQADNICLAGLVVNELDREYENQNQTLQSLARATKIPVLGKLPYTRSFDLAKLAASLDVTQLLSQARLHSQQQT